MTRNLRKSVLVVLGVLLMALAFAMSGSVYADTSSGMITATINYYYYDETAADHKGSEPFPPFVAHMPKGSAAMTERCPMVPGFSPCDINKNSLESVTVNFEADSEVDVFYFPSEVPYIIRLYKQKADLEGYELAEYINGSGITGTEPEEFQADFPVEEIGGRTLENAFEGFTLMYHVPEVIAADGSTEFEVYYDRNYYLINFDLGNGGYGVDPVYAPYESSLNVITPIRAGYNFVGWSPELSDIVTENMTYTALWEKKAQVPYTIIYKNADLSDGSGDTTYSFWGTRTLYADPDAELSIDDIIAANKDNNSLNDFGYFTFDEAATKADNPAQVTVNGDGSTIVRLYYSRNKYKLRFVYLKHTQSTSAVGGDPVTAVQDNHQYVLVNTNKDRSKALSNLEAADGMRAQVDYNNTNFDYLWTLVPVEGGGYYIRFSDGKYLSVNFNGTDVGKPAVMSDTPLKFDITHYDNAEDYFLISTVYNNTTYYLNDKRNAGERVQVYPTSGNGLETANRWRLYDYADATVTTIQSNIKAASGTGNGNFPTSAKMTYVLPNLPEVDTSAGITTGSYTYNHEIYDYVELVAEYNANIEDIWPAAVIGDSGEYSFGSWSTQTGTKYRERNTTHANIVGPYPYMSDEMIVDPSYVYDPNNSESVAQLLWAWWGKHDDYVGPHRYNIYYEKLDGDGYDLDRVIELVAAHNSNTRIDPFVYKGFTVIPEDAGGHSVSHGEANGHHLEYDDEYPDGIWTTDFHYIRNRHSLLYYNYNQYYSTGTDTSSIMYGQPMDEFEAGQPPYPQDLKPGSYEFAGWYTSDTYDELFDWSSTMPDNDVTVYARWKPKSFTINFYNDETDYESGNPYKYTESDDYGTLIDPTEAENNLSAPIITNSTGSYPAAKAGWYYYDEEHNLHAFDPATMTVSGDMDLFMKWSSTVPASFVVHYYVTGTETKVAEDTVGYSFVGLTRTFKAKVEDELNEGYQAHYFPDRRSTSILMKSDYTQNVKTFNYTYRDKVPYTVRYLDKYTKEVLHEEKYVGDNIYSVVSEKYIPIANYVPDSYYISLTLMVSDDPEEEAATNVITFYYTEDLVNMPYHVKYMLENDNGKIQKEVDGETYKFTEANFIDAVGQRGTVKNIPLNSYSGYEVEGYNEVVYIEEDDVEQKVIRPVQDLEPGPATLEMLLEEDVVSKEIHIYYLKKKYPVKLIYNYTGTDDKSVSEWNTRMLANDPELLGEDAFEYNGNTYYRTLYKITDEIKYNETFSATAPEVDGYRITGGKTKSLVVTDDDNTFSKNKLRFVYTKVEEIMFSYHAMIPDGTGLAEADPDEYPLLSYNQVIVTVGDRPGSYVIAEEEDSLYRFVGWYTDEACTQRVQDMEGFNVLAGDEQNELKPLGSNVDKSYYALYEYKRGALEVSSSGCTDPSQSFEYIIKGKDAHNSWIELKICINGNDSRIISGLPIGDYEVTQNNWSWRYTPAERTRNVTVPENDIAQAPFTQTMTNKKWLDGNAYKDNVFSN
ncbi:MAG: hypothetical protein GXY08_11590 [Ruminococcus sp.]|nr:hypothetical protein [Ruminococcus sp.]